MTDFSFRWLHFSDLHFGMRGQAPLWSTLKHKLYDDLPKLLALSGPWDLIIFSGDIVQKGHPEEYAGATEALLELWEKLKELGCSPKFFAVPGNHDMVRPSETDMSVMLLRKWASENTVREEFLGNPSSDYRKTVLDTLTNYQSWYQGLPEKGIPTLDTSDGFLPGDQVFRIETGGKKVGIVGLNSTWLQLTREAKKGDLHVDLAQLSKLLPEAEGWTRANDFNLLVTHHPIEWLNSEAQTTWKSEISPPGRFDLHLFGHLHEPMISSLSTAGSSPITAFQSPSLFGLETLADGTKTRIHGFTAGMLSVAGDVRSLKIWPRIHKLLKSGQSKIIPDHEFDLSDDDVSASIILPPRTQTRRNGTPVEQDTVSPPTAAGRSKSFTATTAIDGEDFLGRFRYHLMPSGPHAFVRKVEQEAASAGLQERSFWIVADWGLSSDEFLASVLEQHSLANRPVYRLDFEEVSASSNLDQEIESRLGFKIQTLSAELSRQSEAVLILDDINLSERELGELPGEVSIENLAQVILDYCPSLIIILRTRSALVNEQFAKAQIGSLDEADLKTYIAKHANGGADLATPDVVGQLFSFTGGVPDRIDRALKALKVVTLSELIAGEGDGIDPTVTAGSLALLRAISELGDTEHPTLQRALQMLRVLATFPHGAQFEHIKRFHGVHGFYADNATELMQRALIISSTLPGLDQQSHAETSRILSVPRSVRDVVRGQMSPEELAQHNNRAAELYFGLDWRTGSTSWPPNRKYSSPKCSHQEIANASAILLRLLRTALSDNDTKEANTLCHLACAYGDSLLDGSHYYSASSFCASFLQVMPQADSEELLHRVRLSYAQALRMIGERGKAIELLESLESVSFDNSRRDTRLLVLALAYETDGNPRAIEVAKKLLKTTKVGNFKLQAREIIIYSSEDTPNRTTKLISLEKEARRKKAFIVANNIAISLAKESDDGDEAHRYLTGVVMSARATDDIYNEARAAVDMVGRQLDEGGILPDADHARLIAAYQYLFIQRIPSIFDRCHGLLWKSFARRGELSNLLALFRHSSFIWRIRGVAPKEEHYMAALSDIVGKDLAIIYDNRDGGYFRSRLQASALPKPTDNTQGS